MTRALILAAGQGTRLRPWTDNKPKCLVSLLGSTLLERQVTVLKSCGVSDIHIATGYRSDQIEAMGFATTRNPRFAMTNMVTTLFSALPFIEREGDLIIGYGDIIYERDNLEKLLKSKDEIALMIDYEWRRYWTLRHQDPLQDAETLVLDNQGFVVEIGKKAENYERIQGQYTGLIKIKSDVIPRFIKFYQSLNRTEYYDGRDFDNMYMTSFLQALINVGWKVKAIGVNGGWLELDSVEDLILYQNLAENGQLEMLCKLNEL